MKSKALSGLFLIRAEEGVSERTSLHTQCTVFCFCTLSEAGAGMNSCGGCSYVLLYHFNPIIEAVLGAL